MSKKNRKNRKVKDPMALPRGIGKLHRAAIIAREMGGVLVVNTNSEKRKMEEEYPGLVVRSREQEKLDLLRR